MLRIRECSDIEECRLIWKSLWPEQSIFDLWEVRDCFNRSFNRPLKLLIAEEGSQIQGALALSWINEAQHFAAFPGETWQGKTWQEQNRIPAVNAEVRHELLECIPKPAHIRYLSPESIAVVNANAEVDETGYIFLPSLYNYSFQSYMQQLSRKFRKNNAREASRLETYGISFRHDTIADVDHLFRMNMDAFGDRSYFISPPFLSAFENLIEWLLNNNMLRITTVLVGDVIAAVDIGAVQGRRYTVLAGGTNAEFMGVAKLINFHHLEWSCSQRFELVDFLCGDFGWKERFRLHPSPLYQITSKLDDLRDKSNARAFAGSSYEL